MISDKVSVRNLPRVSPPIPQGGGRIQTAAGELTQIVNGDLFRFVVYMEFLPDAAAPRGNHYHAAKTESLYIIKGRLRAVYQDIDTERTLETELGEGDLVAIQPRCAHVYYALEYTQAIELSTEPYNPGDTVPFNLAGRDHRAGHQEQETIR